MHEKLMEKLKKHFPYILMEERYKTSRFTEFTSIKSVNDIASTATWRRLCCFAYLMIGVSNNAKEFKSYEKPPEGFKSIFFCSHLSTILDRNLKADLQVSCLLQMSMMVIFVPCIHKSLLGKRLASICSVLVDDDPNGVSGIFLAHLPDFMKEMVWFKKAETEDLMKGLDEFVQKLGVIAAVIFTFIDVKGESKTNMLFCNDHFLNGGWTFCEDIISFFNTIVECYHMECSLSPMRPLLSTSNN